MMIKLECHIVDTQDDSDTEMFWDGHLLLDDQGLHVEMHGRSGMGRLHASDLRKFDVPLDAIRDIEWKDCVVGSLVEISFHDIRYADQFPGTREDHKVELSLREIKDGLAEEMVGFLRNGALKGGGEKSREGS